MFFSLVYLYVITWTLSDIRMDSAGIYRRISSLVHVEVLKRGIFPFCLFLSPVHETPEDLLNKRMNPLIFIFWVYMQTINTFEYAVLLILTQIYNFESLSPLRYRAVTLCLVFYQWPTCFLNIWQSLIFCRMHIVLPCKNIIKWKYFAPSNTFYSIYPIWDPPTLLYINYYL